MGRWAQHKLNAIAAVREQYPGHSLGLLGTVNQDSEPHCECGGYDMIIVWGEGRTILERICTQCLFGKQLALFLETDERNNE